MEVIMLWGSGKLCCSGPSPYISKKTADPLAGLMKTQCDCLDIQFSFPKALEKGPSCLRGILIAAELKC